MGLLSQKMGYGLQDVPRAPVLEIVSALSNCLWRQTVEAKATKADDEDDERGADGKVLTKAQKEKLKKEREKQRKKENVCPDPVYIFGATSKQLNTGC